MEEPPPIPEPQAAEAIPVPRMSLAARLLNVFAVPSEVFADVKAAPASPSNWLAPVALFAVVSALAVCIMFSQPAISQQLREKQMAALDQQVKAGKMTQAQADKAEQFFGGPIIMVAGSVSAVVASFGRVFWWGFILWLMGSKLLKAKVDFHKALEVAGLATMIAVLGTIVAVLLTINLDRLGASPSLGLLFKDFDIDRKSHLFAGAANVFSIWQIVVISIGLAKLAGAPFLRAAWVIFTFWVLQESLLILSGLGQLAQ